MPSSPGRYGTALKLAGRAPGPRVGHRWRRPSPPVSPHRGTMRRSSVIRRNLPHRSGTSLLPRRGSGARRRPSDRPWRTRSWRATPTLADTAAFCAAYGYGLDQSANAIVVVGKSRAAGVRRLPGAGHHPTRRQRCRAAAVRRRRRRRSPRPTRRSRSPGCRSAASPPTACPPASRSGSTAGSWTSTR